MNVTAAVGEQDDALRPWDRGRGDVPGKRCGNPLPREPGPGARPHGGLGGGGGRAARARRAVRRGFLRLVRPLRYVENPLEQPHRMVSHLHDARAAAGARAACAEALAAMAPSDAPSTRRRRPSASPSACRPTPSSGLSPPHRTASRSIEEARYLAEVEEWEYRVLKLRYDAAKTRLRRMREKTGANPRKAGRRNG